MNVPLYFLNKDDVEYIDYIIDTYLFISKEDKTILTSETKKDIVNTLKKRQFIKDNQVIDVCSVIVLVLTSFEDIDCLMDTQFSTQKARHILLKLISIHFDIINDECFVDNHVLFKYIYNSIKKSKPYIKLNNREIYTYNFLKLLQL